jgi:hypothetical protein
VLKLFQIQSQEEVQFQLAAFKLPIVLIFICRISKAFNGRFSLQGRFTYVGSRQANNVFSTWGKGGDMVRLVFHTSGSNV